MNLRVFTMAILASAIPYSASATVKLSPSDFVAAKRRADGETVVNLKLSKSGKAKLKRLNQE